MTSAHSTWEFPSYTKTVHRSSYQAIDPTEPSNSAAGKVVVVTGGHTGIGRGIAAAFVAAGASTVAILGRRETELLDTKRILEEAGKTKILAINADVLDEEKLRNAFKTIADQCGPIDIVIANAGYFPQADPLATTDLVDWWRAFEVNIKGTACTFRAWVPHKAAKTPAFISVSSANAHVAMPNVSAYSASKAAEANLVATINVEHPDIQAVSFHPGVVASEMNTKSKAMLSRDDVSLPSSFAVFSTSPSATFLNGKFVWAHWDVDELKASVDANATNILTLSLNGWPNVIEPTIIA